MSNLCANQMDSHLFLFLSSEYLLPPFKRFSKSNSSRIFPLGPPRPFSFAIAKKISSGSKNFVLVKIILVRQVWTVFILPSFDQVCVIARPYNRRNMLLCNEVSKYHLLIFIFGLKYYHVIFLIKSNFMLLFTFVPRIMLDPHKMNVFE